MSTTKTGRRKLSTLTKSVKSIVDACVASAKKENNYSTLLVKNYDFKTDLENKVADLIAELDKVQTHTAVKFVNCRLALNNIKALNSKTLEFNHCVVTGVYRSNLSSVEFDTCNFSSCVFDRAVLEDATFVNCNLSRAKFNYGNNFLCNAAFDTCNFKNATCREGFSFGTVSIINPKNFGGLLAARTQFIPPTGAFTGWKKLSGGMIAELLIPAKAKRSHSIGTERKCRASEAVVVALYGPNSKRKLPATTVGQSRHNSNFKYVVGATVKPINGFGPNRMEVCAPGIHFFLTREEAEAYY